MLTFSVYALLQMACTIQRTAQSRSLRADAIRPYNYGGSARTMPVDSLEKILCRISIAIIRIFRYNRKDTRQVYAGGLWGVLRRLFVMI